METMRVCGAEYAIIRLLGHGKGGYSYLCTDGAGEYVLKQLHHEPCDYYQFGDKFAAELRDYERLRAAGVPVPALLQAERKTERILKQYIPGPTVFELIGHDAMREDYLRQMYAMLPGLYAAGLNIDYYPTNFVVCGGKLYYVDYECNEYMQPWDFAHWGVKYWSKTPEYLEAAARAACTDSKPCGTDG